MGVDEITELLKNKIKSLENRLNSATINGNINEMIEIQNDIEETQKTLDKINNL